MFGIRSEPMVNWASHIRDNLPQSVGHGDRLSLNARPGSSDKIILLSMFSEKKTITEMEIEWASNFNSLTELMMNEFSTTPLVSGHICETDGMARFRRIMSSHVLSRFQWSDKIPIPRNQPVNRLALISDTIVSAHEYPSKLQMMKESVCFWRDRCFAHFQFNPVKSETFRQFSVNRLSRSSVQNFHFFCSAADRFSAAPHRFKISIERRE
jgi:hypothetical protein